MAGHAGPRCGAWARSTGRPCRAKGNGRGGRCKHHGGASTGPKTAEGRQAISECQTKRWERWRAENPRLFASTKSDRQERRIRRALKQAKQRKKLQDEARAWAAQWKASRAFTPTTQPVFAEFARTASPQELDDLFQIARTEQRETAQPMPEPVSNKPKPYVYPAEWYAPGHSPPATGTPAPIEVIEKAEATIERQPVWVQQRLARAAQIEAEQEHGKALIERYDRRERPPTYVGSLRRRRR